MAHWQEAESQTPAGEADDAQRPLLEIGWMVVGQLDETDLHAVVQARDTLLAYFREILGDFTWRMPMTRHEELGQGLREQPVQLFGFGTSEREVRHWDFGVVFTAADLVSYEKPYALATLSTALGVAVISTARIDPLAEGNDTPEEQRVATMAGRIETLVLHSFGHLIGLEHKEDAACCMYPFETVQELDRSRRFCEGQLEPMLEQLQEIADRRLEERPELKRASHAKFYLYGMWRNRREIVQAIWRAEPWLFPVRLSRLATAAFSALVILILTAESWELGMSLPLSTSGSLALACLLVTTGYVTMHQRLFIRRGQRGMREQKVVANVSALLIVLLGMLVTFALLFTLTLAATLVLFSRGVVESWAASIEYIDWPQYVSLAMFVASVGMVIGALGASFEDQYYFRHVTFVDEEI